MTVLSFFAELLDESLPDHDPQETIFRLLVSVLEQTTVEQPWMPLTYFQLWMTRLMGLLPEIGHCTACGEALTAGEASFNTLGSRLVATGAAHVAGAGGCLCCGAVAAAARAGPAPLYAASSGAASGAQTALGRGAGAAVRN
jgi:DNA repair protein RecO (recombination protein O)